MMVGQEHAQELGEHAATHQIHQMEAVVAERRIDLRLRVRWSATTPTGDVSGEAEASDVSPKGLRLESEHDVASGTPLHLVVDVGGDTDELIAELRRHWHEEDVVEREAERGFARQHGRG